MWCSTRRGLTMANGVALQHIPRRVCVFWRQRLRINRCFWVWRNTASWPNPNRGNAAGSGGQPNGANDAQCGRHGACTVRAAKFSTGRIWMQTRAGSQTAIRKLKITALPPMANNQTIRQRFHWWQHCRAAINGVLFLQPRMALRITNFWGNEFAAKCVWSAGKLRMRSYIP